MKGKQAIVFYRQHAWSIIYKHGCFSYSTPNGVGSCLSYEIHKIAPSLNYTCNN